MEGETKKAVTRQSADPLALAEGAIGVGLLVYGITAVHRLFWANLFPFSYHVTATLWSLPDALVWLLHGAALVILLASVAIVAWAWYHAHRAELSFWRGLPTAFVLAIPLLVYELTRRATDVDIFERLVSTVLSLTP